MKDIYVQMLIVVEYILQNDQFKAKLQNEILPMILEKYPQCKVDLYPDTLKWILTNDDLSTCEKIVRLAYVVGNEKSKKSKQNGNSKDNFNFAIDGKLSNIGSDLANICIGNGVSTLLNTGHKIWCSIKENNGRNKDDTSSV